MGDERGILVAKGSFTTEINFLYILVSIETIN